MKRNKLYKKILVSLFLIGILFNFTSCINHMELDRKIIVQAVSIDYDSEEEIFTICMQFPKNEVSPDSGEVKNEGKVTLKAQGGSFYEAFHKISDNSAQQLILSECQILVLGNKAEWANVGEVVKAFSDYYETYPKILVAVAKDSGEELISVNYNDMSPTEHTLKILINALSEKGRVLPIGIRNIMQDIHSEHKEIFLPLFGVSKEESEGENESEKEKSSPKAEYLGGCIYRENIYEGDISEDEAAVLNWLSTGKTEMKLTNHVEGSEKIMGFSNLKYKVSMKESNEGNLIVEYKINTKVHMLEEHIDISSLEEANKIEKVAEEEIKRKVVDSLNKVCGEYNADIFEIGVQLRHNNYKLWKKYKEGNKNISEAEFRVFVEAKLDRYWVRW